MALHFDRANGISHRGMLHSEGIDFSIGALAFVCLRSGVRRSVLLQLGLLGDYVPVAGFHQVNASCDGLKIRFFEDHNG